MKIITIVILLISDVMVKADIDCDSISGETREFVNNGIDNSLVFMVSESNCLDCVRTELSLINIGFHENDLNIVQIDDLPNKFEILDYKWCLTGSRNLPTVWANQTIVGGSEETTGGYWSGELVKLAYDSRLKRAARDFVDAGIKNSAENNQYFVISKDGCPFCVFSKMCFKKAGVDPKLINSVTINNFVTHDQIKEYAGEITGYPGTPRIWFDGQIVGGYMELKEKTGC